LATALLRADGATTGVDHGVRGWRFWWVSKKVGWEVWRSPCPHPFLYPTEGLLRMHAAFFPCYYLC
jgi:hypothetical protein